MLKQDPLQYRELAAKAVQDEQLHKALASSGTNSAVTP